MRESGDKPAAVGAHPTNAVLHLTEVTDRMHPLRMDRTDALMGCTGTARRRACWRP